MDDASAAVEHGADAIGLVFYSPSPRAVDVQTAAAIARALPAMVSAVGVFVNAEREEIADIVARVPLDILQFHGDETPEDCDALGKPYMKAVRMSEGTDLSAYAERYSRAKALLVDTFKKGVPGGTGETFDWSRIPGARTKPIVLAGGLNATNVRAAVDRVKPFAVDVSGGVEASGGIKDREKIAAFMREVSGE